MGDSLAQCLAQTWSQMDFITTNQTDTLRPRRCGSPDIYMGGTRLPSESVRTVDKMVLVDYQYCLLLFDRIQSLIFFSE